MDNYLLFIDLSAAAANYSCAIAVTACGSANGHFSNGMLSKFPINPTCCSTSSDLVKVWPSLGGMSLGIV